MKLNGAQPQPTGLVGCLDNGKVSETRWTPPAGLTQAIDSPSLPQG
jgi:hypothetical protein